MNMTPVEIGEHVRLRLTLETMAWLGAAARGDAARFAELRKRLEAIKAAVAAGNHEEVAQADLDFHREIWRMAGGLDNGTSVGPGDRAAAGLREGPPEPPP
jgi:DNA-binding GntR family transcriptional regulator